MSRAKDLKITSLDFSFDSMSTPLFKDLNFVARKGWTGIVGSNGSGKTTLLKIIARELRAPRGSVQAPKRLLLCPQRTDEVPPGFSDFMADYESEALMIRSRLAIEDDWPHRWQSLSHGERKRAQIATLLWKEAEVALVDEASNHLDKEALKILSKTLKTYKGIGLIVSHDRQLLDDLCYQCLFLDPPKARMRPGGYSKGREAEELEREHRKKLLEEKTHELKRLKREASKRRELASRSHHLRSKRGLAIKDHDARAKINKARVTGKDSTGGKLLLQMEGRVNQVEREKEAIGIDKSYDTGIFIRNERSKRDYLFRLKQGSIPLGKEQSLTFPELLMDTSDRIVLSGPNGSGKSSLIEHIVNKVVVERVEMSYIPQEIGMEETKRIMEEIKESKREELGRIMSIVRRLNSDPERLLETEMPSPGETRKLLIAMGMAIEPHLIVLDEANNHMDLISIEALETALDQCKCGLLLVTHDELLSMRLGQKEWRFIEVPEGYRVEPRIKRS